MVKKPLVSVCMITYNQEGFIKESIEPILCQDVDFDFELIVSDDASLDNTEQVVREIIENHPKGHLIRYTRHKNNSGMSANFQSALNECNGEFIAICEGDDYWTDPLKLQKQVCFLERNENYVMVADNSIWYDISENKKRLFNDEPERDINVLELLEKRQFATASVLFRNSKELIENIEKILGDTMLWVFLSTLGKIKYRPEVTSVYRRHQSGAVLGSDRLEWAKRMEMWNIGLKEIAPHIPSSVFKERNFREFKFASEFYLGYGNYKMYLFSIYKVIKVDKILGANLFLNHLKAKIKRNLFDL